MTDFRFIHANDGRVLTIEIAGTSYTPEEIRAALDELQTIRAILNEDIATQEQLVQCAQELYVAVKGCERLRADVQMRDARIAELERECARLEAAREQAHSAWQTAERSLERLREEIASDARIRELELTLIDYENWIEAAVRHTGLPRPSSFGQWRRPT